MFDRLKRTQQLIEHNSYGFVSFIGGFHVTQVSLIITQVKNKIAYVSVNWVNKSNK